MVHSYSTVHIHNGRSHSTAHYTIVTVMLYVCSLLCVILCQCSWCCQTFSPQTTSSKLLVHHHDQTTTATGHNMQLIALLAHVCYKAKGGAPVFWHTVVIAGLCLFLCHSQTEQY